MGKVTHKDAAIIIPLPVTDSFSDSEKISLQHLITHLGNYDKYFVVAEKFASDHINIDGFKVKRFDDKFFGSILAHNKLLTNKLFYEAFADYKFILIYHLDALVFSDKLLYWCEQDYDCIAPPWLASEIKWLDKSTVGNGGFALRKVQSMIKLYSSKRYWQAPGTMARKFVRKFGPAGWLLYPVARIVFSMPYFNNMQIHLNQYLKQKWSAEDRFIALFGNHYLPELNIASVEEALKFAFETNPKKCYQLNNEQIPFGCHAFERYDRAFWEPYMLQPKEEFEKAS